jgi:CHAT domain-containing protein
MISLRFLILVKAVLATGMRLAPSSVAVAMAIGLVSIPVQSTAQSQIPQSAEQSAALQEAERLNQQVVQLYKKGKYAEAIPLAERSLALSEKVLGKEHPSVAQSLHNLAALYLQQVSYQKAEPLYLRSLAIWEKTLGKEHPSVAESLNDLAALYQQQGSYQKAEPLYLRSLAIREKALGKEHPDVAQSLHNLAALFEQQVSYQKAEPLYLRSLAIREKTLGKEHPSVAESLNDLAVLYQQQGSYQKAEPLYLRSLAIREKALGGEHPDVATSLNNLAELYWHQGSYQKAEPLYLRSLAIREKTLGKEHPDVAQSLNDLAVLYRQQGSYQKAEPLYLRSLAIREKALGKEHPDVAQSLHNLAELYWHQGSYQKAEPLYLRSLAIYEKAVGKEHPHVASSLGGLANLYSQQGSYQKAEPLYLRSLAIWEKALGKEHPDVAQSLNNLAALYQQQGSYQKAEPLYLRSLAIWEKTLGKEHPHVARSLTNLALLYMAQKDIIRATDFLRRGLAVEERNFTLIYAVGSEQRKQNYATTFVESTNVAISLLLQEAPKNSEVARLAVTTVLRRKGRVLDAVTDSIQTLRSQLANQPETQKLFDQWLNIRQQQATIVYREQEKQTVEAFQTQFKRLEEEKERLEETMSAKSAEFHNETQPVELEAIQAKIPKDAALVEIVQYYPLNAKTDKRGKLRYAAAVLRSFGEPNWVDLGDAAAINESVSQLGRAFNKELLKTVPEVQELARKLDEQLMAPIRPLLGSARHLLLSPDGQLALIPFEALQDDKGQYLIQRYAFSYLTTGRDLLQFQSDTTSGSTPVVFADIDYDNQEVLRTTMRGVQNRRSIDLASLNFGALAATDQEAKQIKAIFPQTKILSGKQATENAVKQLKAPSILHLATHGFFLPDQEVPLVKDEFNQQQPKAFNPENPLLRSGLALAGFNNRYKIEANMNDGVLTGLEVAGLNLRGTQLVVLSACETGLGDTKVGEGLYGLRRALVIAGSQSEVLSLWKVDDAGTKDLMVKYYQNLKAGQGRHEALRSAQLELLSQDDYKHPYYWASFVPSGNWTPLNNR